jgi:hypothetical protein
MVQTESVEREDIQVNQETTADLDRRDTRENR